MDLVGESDSSQRYFDWVDRVVSKQEDKVKKIIKMGNTNEPLLNSDFLPARYNLDGNETEDEWPNFQLDGYGTWLWALCEHIKITGNTQLINKYSKSIKITTDYLINFWNHPNYDCWEENGDKMHTSTLACIYGGLNSIGEYCYEDSIKTVAKQVKEYILHNCVINGRLVKFEGSQNIDASLLWVSIPFNAVSIDDDIMVKTIEEIENRLLHNGGVHRYPEDTYYGGGEWLLLSCWLGWYYCETGEVEKTKELLTWVENNTNAIGEMPEQSLKHVNDYKYIEQWENLWGEVATPLLWSHAMYLILLQKFLEIKTDAESYIEVLSVKSL